MHIMLSYIQAVIEPDVVAWPVIVSKLHHNNDGALFPPLNKGWFFNAQK